jgi:hypothetical protein
MTTTVVLGDEYDQHLRAVLVQVLLQLGAVLENRNWVVAGSQEVETFLWQLAGQDITVEAETYMGLSISEMKTPSTISRSVLARPCRLPADYPALRWP